MQFPETGFHYDAIYEMAIVIGNINDGYTAELEVGIAV
jgi:hypothetical protein